MELAQIIESIGFDKTGYCPASSLAPKEDVRTMCQANLCHAYGANWTCPPECGTVDDFAKRFAQCEDCFVLATIMQLEDDFDYETMMEASEKHKKRMKALSDVIADYKQDTGEYVLVLGAGPCDRCGTCAYPDTPCRFPNKQIVAMEATGLVVADVCKAAGIAYNNGPQTIAYFGCVIH